MLMRFVGSNSQVYYDNGYLQFFQAGYFFSKKHCHVINETTNYDFILPCRTCQRHLETKATNV